MISPLLILCLLGLIFCRCSHSVNAEVASDATVIDVLNASHKGGGGSNAPLMYWSPAIIVTNNNNTLLFAQASFSKEGASWQTRGGDDVWLLRSADNGYTWSSHKAVPGLSDSQHETSYNVQVLYAPSTGTLFATTSPNYGNSGHIANSFIMSSTDEGLTWSALIPLPDHVLGLPSLGLGHGLELNDGSHFGRLLFAREWFHPSKGSRVGVLYSDDGGKNWTLGALLPEGFAEPSIVQLTNGSVLLSSRIDPKRIAGKARGFARSDDGGETWTQVWFLRDSAALLFATCFQPMVVDPNSGIIYYGHPGAWPPGNRDRSNYTIHKSSDGGQSWQFFTRVYSGGAGYSDIQMLPNNQIGVAFQRTLYENGVEGGGYNMAYANVKTESLELQTIDAVII